MAAGLSMEEKNVESFRDCINEQCMLSDDDLCAKVQLDMVLPLSVISEEFINELSIMEPFGRGNRKPVFVTRDVLILKTTVMGKNKKSLRFLVRDERGTTIEALYFKDCDYFFSWLSRKYPDCSKERFLQGQERNVKMTIAYYPSLNEYNGRKKLQIIIGHIL